MRQLHVVNCKIETIEDEGASEVFKQAGKALKKLDLSYNQIGAIPYSLMTDCSNITHLNLASN